MVARIRSVVWSASAQAALDEVIRYIAQDSPEAALRVLEKALEAGDTLAALAERGRMVPEFGDAAIRELFVFQYRLMYEVHTDQVVIVAFVHGARDFVASRKNEAPE